MRIDHSATSNPHSFPFVSKAVISCCWNSSKIDKKSKELSISNLIAISGQKPAISIAKKSISEFKIREGQEIGCYVTLRKLNMYVFFDHIINMAITRDTSFLSISESKFDNSNNLNIGFKDMSLFPQANQDKSNLTIGCNISLNIKNSRSVDDSKKLLLSLGFPVNS